MVLKITQSVIFHFALLLYWDLIKMSKSIQFDFTRELGDPHAGIGKKQKKQVKILKKQDIRQDKRFESRTSRTKGPKAGRPAQSRTRGISGISLTSNIPTLRSLEAKRRMHFDH